MRRPAQAKYIAPAIHALLFLANVGSFRWLRSVFNEWPGGADIRHSFRCGFSIFSVRLRSHLH